MSRRWIPWAIAAAAMLCLLLCAHMGSSGFGLPDWNDPTGRTILSLRLQRVLAGFVVGAGLSCAGVVLQALLRNPLAEPYVLGVSSGAGVGAAAAILSGLSAAGVLALPAIAFAFAVATLAIVYRLAISGGRLSVYGLILSGVIVSSICSSVLMFLVAVAPLEGMHSILWWMLGNLQAPPTTLFIAVGLLIAGGVALLWLLAPELNALSLGQEMAHHVGVRTRLAVSLGLLLATLVTAAAVSMAGLIGFVGLVVPHGMRSLVGPDHRRLLPAAALGGGAFLALCDAVARFALRPMELPVGVVTALVGGPFFLSILRRRRRQGWLE